MSRLLKPMAKAILNREDSVDGHKHIILNNFIPAAISRTKLAGSEAAQSIRRALMASQYSSSRYLNYCINVPNKIGSFSSGATTSMVVKNGTKKTFEVFFGSRHASRKLHYSLCFSTYMKMDNRILSYIILYYPILSYSLLKVLHIQNKLRVVMFKR